MACGVVDVKRVASVADRGIVAMIRDDQVRRKRVQCCYWYTRIECTPGFPEVRFAVPREFLVAERFRQSSDNIIFGSLTFVSWKIYKQIYLRTSELEHRCG